MKKETIVLRRDIPNTSSSRPPQRKRKRKNNNSLTYFLMLIFVGICVLILSMTVLFNAKQIKITGSTHYTNEQITAAAGVAQGTNLVRLNSGKSEEKVETTLVFVENCEVIKRFPSTIEIKITEAKETANVQILNNYCVISENGKILENRLTQPKSGLPVVVGLESSDDTVSTVIQSADANKVSIILELLGQLPEAKLEKTTQIDITDRTNINLTYDNRIHIEIGSSYDLGYKLNYVSEIIYDKLSNNWEGTIIYHSATAGASAIKKGDELVNQIKPEDNSEEESSSESNE